MCMSLARVYPLSDARSIATDRRLVWHHVHAYVQGVIQRDCRAMCVELSSTVSICLSVDCLSVDCLYVFTLCTVR